MIVCGAQIPEQMRDEIKMDNANRIRKPRDIIRNKQTSHEK
jgi:hypothetical protein